MFGPIHIPYHFVRYERIRGAVEQYQVTVKAGPLRLQNLFEAVEQYQASDVQPAHGTPSPYNIISNIVIFSTERQVMQARAYLEVSFHNFII